MVVLDQRVLPAQQWQAICLPYLGGVFLTQQSTDLLNKGKERIRFQIKKQGDNTIPKNMMKNAFKNLLFSITSIATTLQSTVWLAFVACNQSTKESEKRSVFKWVAVLFRTKFDSKKNFKLDNQTYLGPKNLRSFLPLNQKASLVVPEEIVTEKEMKEQFLSEFRFLWWWNQWNFTKKQQSNEPFCLVKRLVTSAKGLLSWNEEKRKRQHKEEKYVRFLIEETGMHLPVHHGHIFWNLDTGFLGTVVGCVLQFLSAVHHVSRDLAAIYLAVGCTWIYHKCRDVAEGRPAYMINLARHSHT